MAVSVTISPNMTVQDLQRLADEDLMPLVEARNPDAFAILYDRHGGAAYSLAYRMVGDRSAAEDVTQEAFISLWRSRARYDRARGSVRTWVLGIVRNRAIDLLRRDLVQAPTLRFDEEMQEKRPSSEETDVEALRREAARQVRGALDVLPADQMRVVELAYFGGMTHSQIASMLNMPIGTVKGRMRLAMEKIRGQLAEGIQ
jgi:RNA polymerase sigma-70 factor (ECF subfamily)